jgi:glycosyltransferase involved in cell wall biosynthesis
LSIVTPIYNEADTIEILLRAIREALSGLRLPYEVIIVDDGSTDGSWKVLRDIARRNDWVQILRAIRLSRNFGKEAAIAAGLEMSCGDAVIVMDGDLQHPPSMIPDMIRLWEKAEGGVDVVEAVKQERTNESIFHTCAARVFYSVFGRLSGFRMNNTTDFKLMDRRVVNAWLKMREHNLFFRGMTEWLGFRHVEIPFIAPDRRNGRSKWSLFSLIKMSTNAISSFTSVPLQLVTIFGFVFLLFALLLGAEAFWMKITGRALEGFTTVNLLLLIIGSFLMISLGIIGIYIGRIYEEVKRRPRYIKDETIDNANRES